MQNVNPIGRTIQTLNLGSEIEITPLACICSNGAQTMRINFGGCQNCVCSCDYGTTNQAANHDIAFAWDGV